MEIDPACPSPGPHGSLYAYKALKCRCPATMVLHRKYVKLYNIEWKRGQHRLVSSVGARRRVQALALNGLTMRQIAEYCPMTSFSHLTRICQGKPPKIRKCRHDEIDRAFRQLMFVRPTTSYADMVRTRSRKKHWKPALAWINIDDPAEQPTAVRRPSTKRRAA